MRCGTRALFKLVLLGWFGMSVIIFYWSQRILSDSKVTALLERDEVHPVEPLAVPALTAVPNKLEQIDYDLGSWPLYPSKQYYSDDRILKQLNYVPGVVRRLQSEGQAVPVKKILLIGANVKWDIAAGSSRFQQDQCAVQACEVTYTYDYLKEADVVLSKYFDGPMTSLTAKQIWGIYSLESPYHTGHFPASRRHFNWTASYRHDSTIVAPYEKYVPLNPSVLTRSPVKNFAAGKTKKVAWFVSNCDDKNGRLAYANKLSKHIQVDIYGSCGSLSCPRDRPGTCFTMLNKDYKFYLAFENSNCRDYITEKFFINGLKNDVIPIVMGAAPEDYRRAAPPHSFIHVDDYESPEKLAAYLHKLDTDDALYNQYFAWKGLWDNINTYFWCRVCALAHDVEERGPSWYEDYSRWWHRDPGICIGTDTWRTFIRTKPTISDLPVHLGKV